MSKIKVKPNSNFISLKGDNLPVYVSKEYKEYRRQWMDNPQKFIVRKMPIHLDIEASSRCNLRCTFCDKLPLLRSEQLGNMDFELFKHIVDQFKDSPLWGLKLSYRGEPLINKDVPKMVRYAKEHGVLDVYFNTNAMLLDENMSRQLIEAHLDRVSISIDGTCKEEYERVRIGAKYELLIKNLTTLIDLKKELGVDYPKIRIQTVRFPDTDSKAYLETWGDYADEIAMVDYKDESFRNTELRGDWACPQLWQRMTIEWDGSVFGCNNDDVRGLYVGNVSEKSIYDCWHDEKLEEVRLLHRQGKSHCVDDCNGCPWRTAQIGKD